MYDAQLDGHADCTDVAASPAGYDNAAASITSQRGTASLQAALLLRMLDEIDYGLIVLGAEAQILHANQLARLELNGERFIRLRQDRLAPSSARHGATLETALAKAGRGQRSLVTLSGGADGGLTLSIVPLGSSASSAAQTADAPSALVILGKRDACEALTLQQYGQLHKLTGAEQALLPAISRGLGVEAIAQQQCVALSTVRTQLGSIREKTGVTSLRMLMARLNNLPPLRPSSILAQVH
jgi:DNA-binding CsgD family transcriptional regulator